MRGCERRHGVLVAVLLAAVAMGGCSASVTSPSGSADCKRIAHFTHGKAPDKVAPHRKLPLPHDITHAAASVVDKGDPPSIGPKESSIGTRDSLVDNLVVVAELTTDVEDAEHQVNSAIKSDRMHANARSGTSSNGTKLDFSLGYDGDYRDGKVATYQCGDANWLVLTDSLVPDFPKSAGEPLPGCEALVGKVPSKVYSDPVRIDDYGQETDDKDGSTRTCGVHNRGDDYELSGSFDIEVHRPKLSPKEWYHRLEDLAGDPKEFAKSACAGQGFPKTHPLPGGPKGASYCADKIAENQLSAAVRVGDDYWVGVSSDGGDLTKKQLRDDASAILAALLEL